MSKFEDTRVAKKFTPEEIEAMNMGTARVRHKKNGSLWLAWERKGVFRAKWHSGELPEGMSTTVKMTQDEFFEIFKVC